MIAIKRFDSQTTETIIAHNDNMAEISFFDVKELYEIAYAEKSADGTPSPRFNLLLKRAEKMDTAYRAQLALQTTIRYQKAA
ncbi:MAG TPA: hypothetical protein PLF01_07010 [Alphaproteobacteria bacterium]|nr:hypothetical protein [Alphaproteobacteria bacterium]